MTFPLVGQSRYRTCCCHVKTFVFGFAIFQIFVSSFQLIKVLLTPCPEETDPFPASDTGPMGNGTGTSEGLDLLTSVVAPGECDNKPMNLFLVMAVLSVSCMTIYGIKRGPWHWLLPQLVLQIINVVVIALASVLALIAVLVTAVIDDPAVMVIALVATFVVCLCLVGVSAFVLMATVRCIQYLRTDQTQDQTDGRGMYMSTTVTDSVAPGVQPTAPPFLPPSSSAAFDPPPPYAAVAQPAEAPMFEKPKQPAEAPIIDKPEKQ